MNGSLAVCVPDELFERVAERAAELVLARLAPERDAFGSPWLSGAKAAAEYLGWPAERVYKRLSALPHYREGNRLMFRRDELDRWLDGHREGSTR